MPVDYFRVCVNLHQLLHPTVPTPPTQVSAANTTNSAKLQVTWQRPECDNGVLLGYTVSQHMTLSETILSIILILA